MAARYIDLTGQRFDRLTVIELAGKTKSNSVLWVCKCDCGNFSTPQSNALRNGSARSCGCLAREKQLTQHTTHDMCKTAEYECWKNMKARCNNPSNPAFRNYGGRGITVCDRWLRFAPFFADMGKKPANTSIERLDNEAGYTPDNCCWATKVQQCANQRRSVKNIECLTCGAEFKPTWQKDRVSKYCCRECYWQALRHDSLAST